MEYDHTLWHWDKSALKSCAARPARIEVGPAAIALTPRSDFSGDTAGLDAKGERLLLRGDPGPDPLGTLTALLERLMPA